jgi:hypothetical protein
MHFQSIMIGRSTTIRSVGAQAHRISMGHPLRGSKCFYHAFSINRLWLARALSHSSWDPNTIHTHFQGVQSTCDWLQHYSTKFFVGAHTHTISMAYPIRILKCCNYHSNGHKPHQLHSLPQQEQSQQEPQQYSSYEQEHSP